MPFGKDGPRVLAAIETVWEVLQESHPELPDVYVIVDRAGARHALAWPENLEPDMRPELPIHQDAIRAGARSTLEAILHVATHALCHVRGISETSNRGMRHNKHFRAVAEELGMKWPEGEPPHPTKGFSPVPLTPEAVNGYGPPAHCPGPLPGRGGPGRGGARRPGGGGQGQVRVSDHPSV
ncbi:hypothetical protein HOS58_gp24 [Streptomyces phage Attoomi]|uniref:Peptidase n=1 Tax=Streptomyces phage Attoomi TaxID=2059881 RepID=A0A2H5BLE9_9CAUD|nr:hypothetical protein HOS58_gp24 [Streptomyces phage Attoomi]AUG87156.1 hypothetical protein SEA_ATTOOMI_24 [Streptomyces phage Attoomi]